MPPAVVLACHQHVDALFDRLKGEDSIDSGATSIARTKFKEVKEVNVTHDLPF